MNDELLPAYLAVIRYELGSGPGEDAIEALAGRLNPAKRADRPPASAPAIARLRATLASLRRETTPDCSLEQLTEDLRFLALFTNDEPVLSGSAMDALLADVLDGTPSQPARSTRTRRSADA